MSCFSSGDLKLKLTQKLKNRLLLPVQLPGKTVFKTASQEREKVNFSLCTCAQWHKREGVSLIRSATSTHSLTPVQRINEPKGKCYTTLKFIRCRNMFSHETKANKSIIQGTSGLYMRASPEEVLYATSPVIQSHEVSGSILIRHV